MTALPQRAAFAIDHFLHEQESKSLLRFVACGSVDHGKSSLLGRLLYEANQVHDDQLESLAADTRKHGHEVGDLDFSLLLDGLAAEREQKITIDIAYRFFATSKRKFIVADAPGHEQYTRNMATGASTADLALVLVNAQAGLTAQTRRHTSIVAMLGVRHLTVAINKMDLVDWSENSFAAIEKQFSTFAKDLGFETIVVIPTSARTGDNIVSTSAHMPWYRGPTLLEHLERVNTTPAMRKSAFRMPVQWVNRPHLDFRGYSGLIVGGEVRVGDTVRILPSARTTQIARIVAADGDLRHAIAGQAVTLTFTDHIDASRGDVIADAATPPLAADILKTRVFWMDHEALIPGRRYLIKLAASTAMAIVGSDLRMRDIGSQQTENVAQLAPNALGHCVLRLDRPIGVDRYADNKEMGGFILIDPESNDTVGMGMIDAAEASATTKGASVKGARRFQIFSDAVRLLRRGESHKRSWAKALSWRATGSLGTFAIAFLVTGNLILSGSIVFAELLVKTIFYYVHERAWSSISFGKR